MDTDPTPHDKSPGPQRTRTLRSQGCRIYFLAAAVSPAMTRFILKLPNRMLSYKSKLAPTLDALNINIKTLENYMINSRIL
jgi:hypothetical protein